MKKGLLYFLTLIILCLLAALIWMWKNGCNGKGKTPCPCETKLKHPKEFHKYLLNKKGNFANALHFDTLHKAIIAKDTSGSMDTFKLANGVGCFMVHNIDKRSREPYDSLVIFDPLFDPSFKPTAFDIRNFSTEGPGNLPVYWWDPNTPTFRIRGTVDGMGTGFTGTGSMLPFGIYYYFSVPVYSVSPNATSFNPAANPYLYLGVDPTGNCPNMLIVAQSAGQKVIIDKINKGGQ